MHPPNTDAVWSLLLETRIQEEGRPLHWQAAMPTVAQTLPWLNAGFPSTGAGSCESVAGCVPLLGDAFSVHTPSFTSLSWHSLAHMAWAREEG